MGKRMVTYKGTPIRQSTDFSAETVQVGREWNDILKILNDKTVTQDYPVQRSYHLDMNEQYFSRQTKAEGVHQH